MTGDGFHGLPMIPMPAHEHGRAGRFQEQLDHRPALPSANTTREDPLMVTHPTYCYACRESHEIAVVDRERLIYVLQAGELDTALRMGAIEGPVREPDTFDCLLTWLELAGDSEGYAEHVEQAVACRRALAGVRPGDRDLCRCGELIHFVELPTHGRSPIRRWEHTDATAWVKCRDAKPDEEVRR